jgi:hypothetical protein
VIGSLCYVVYPPQLAPAGAKVSYRGVMLGYDDERMREDNDCLVVEIICMTMRLIEMMGHSLIV